MEPWNIAAPSVGTWATHPRLTRPTRRFGTGEVVLPGDQIAVPSPQNLARAPLNIIFFPIFSFVFNPPGRDMLVARNQIDAGFTPR